MKKKQLNHSPNKIKIKNHLKMNKVSTNTNPKWIEDVFHLYTTHHQQDDDDDDDVLSTIHFIKSTTTTSFWWWLMFGHYD